MFGSLIHHGNSSVFTRSTNDPSGVKTSSHPAQVQIHVSEDTDMEELNLEDSISPQNTGRVRDEGRTRSSRRGQGHPGGHEHRPGCVHSTSKRSPSNPNVIFRRPSEMGPGLLY